MSSPGKRVQSRETPEAEVAADDEWRNVGFATGAESDERGGDHRRGLQVCDRKKKDGDARNQQHRLINTHPEEAVQNRSDEKSPEKPSSTDHRDCVCGTLC